MTQITCIAKRPVPAWLALIFIAMTGWAAAPVGSITGSVTDAHGASVAGAKVVVTNPATGLVRDVVSERDGSYVCTLLPPGLYTVTVEAPGFKQFEQPGVEVKAEVATSVYAQLDVGAVTERVVVTGEAPLVDTRSGTLRETIEQNAIEDLPLDGRNAADLALLSSGTSSLTLGGTGEAASGNGAGTYGDLEQPVTYPGAEYISANGAQGQGVNYLLYGGSNVDIYSNVNNPFPNPEALDQFAVQTNNFSAEYGRGVGAVVSIVTRSGNNDLHGNVFEFLRNGAANRARFSFGSASQADRLIRNQFGGSLGGPVVHDKLFYFGNYQGTILTNHTYGNPVRVFSTAEESGDFTDIGLGNLGSPNPASANLMKYQLITHMVTIFRIVA